MVAEIWDRFEAIEECYEFMLAYAAQGLASDEGCESGRQLRRFLSRAAESLDGLAESCATAVREESRTQEGRFNAFLAVLDRDARDSLAAMDLVLAQPAISSQLIDNLNASMHLRARFSDHTRSRRCSGLSGSITTCESRLRLEFLPARSSPGSPGSRPVAR
jgi:hypothetical protein